MKKTQLLFGAIVAALAVSNVLLLRQNLQLRAALAQGEPESLRAGDRVPSFSAPGLGGGRVEVDYAGAPTRRVLFYFTPSCRYCREQFAQWREILTQADRQRFEVIGLARDAEDRARLEAYLESLGCGAGSQTPLRVALIPESVRDRYKLSATPITLVVGAGGVVEKSWTGLWSEGTRAEAGALFGFDLPAVGERRASL